MLGDVDFKNLDICLLWFSRVTAADVDLLDLDPEMLDCGGFNLQ